MPELLRMPEVLANSTEAILQSWAVTRDEAFGAGDVIATVETEKAVVDVEAERAGVLLVSLVGDGGAVAVGTPIAVVGEPGERVADEAALLASLGVGSDQPPEAATVVPPASESSAVPEATGPAEAPRLFASPLARRLAKEHGLSIADLRGSGPRGRIVRRDVEAAVAERGARLPATPPTPVAPVGGFVDEPHSKLRRAVARRLTESKQQVPHFYLRATPEVDRLLRLRADLNRHAPSKVSVNDLVVKAAACALQDVPDLNVIWTEDAVRHLHGIDVGVAVAGGRGLVTPVIRAVDRVPVAELAARTADLRTRADAGTLRQDELEGGALTVTNLGMFGTEEFLAIINPPQAAILAVGAVREAPAVRDGTVTPASVMTVTLSVDHRPVDGVVAARWLAAFVAAVEDPVRLLV